MPPIVKPEKVATLEQLRKEAARLKGELDKWQSHIARLQREYGNVEDEIYAFEQQLDAAKLVHGITEEEVDAEPDPLDMDLDLN